MTTFADVPAFNVQNAWGFYSNGGGFSAPVATSDGGVQFTYPGGAPNGGGAGAAAASSWSAATVGDTLFDFDLTWPPDTEQIVPQIFVDLGGQSAYVHLRAFDNENGVYMQFGCGIGGPDNSPASYFGSRPSRVRLLHTSDGLTLSLYADGVWQTRAEVAYSGSLAAVSCHAEMIASSGTTVGGTFAYHLHSAVVPALAQAAPTLGTATSHSQPLTWPQPTNVPNGSTVTYDVQRANTLTPSRDSDYTTIASALTATSYTDPARQGSTPASYRIIAHATVNSTTTDATSAPASGTTAAAVLSGITVTGAAQSVTPPNTLQFTATGAYDDNTTRTLGSGDGVQWTFSVGSVNASGLATPPAQSSSLQTVTVTATAGGKSGAATYTVPAASSQPGIPVIRVRDGLTGQVLASGATIDLGMQAGLSGADKIRTRALLIDNGDPTGHDDALTGLAATFAVNAAELAAACLEPTGATVCVVTATSPDTAPDPVPADAELHLTSTATGVQPFTLFVKRSVGAGDPVLAFLAQILALGQIANINVAQLIAQSGTMAEQAQAVSGQLQTDGVPVTSGSASAIASQTQQAIAPGIAAARASADAAKGSADGAAASGSTLVQRVPRPLAIDANGNVTATNGGGIVDLIGVARTTDVAAARDHTDATVASALTAIVTHTDAVVGPVGQAVTALGSTLPQTVSTGVVTAMTAPRGAITGPPPVDGASWAQQLGWNYAVGRPRNLRVADDAGVSTFGADGTTLLARENVSQHADGATANVAGA